MIATKNQARNGYLSQVAGLKLLGEIITWSAGAKSHTHNQTLEALRQAGMNEKLAKELLPRYAFSRACKKLADARIIRQIKDNGQLIHFQFTKELVNEQTDKYDYSFETVVVLDKVTGVIVCDDRLIAEQARAELDKAMERRTTSDISKIVQKAFDAEADLFPIRDNGGAYFVPECYSGFVSKIETFLNTLGGNVQRFPIPAGTRSGDQSVKNAVATGLQAVVTEYTEAVQQFGLDTRPTTLEKHADKIRAAKFKVQLYSEMLAERQAELEKSLADCAQKLQERMDHLSQVNASDTGKADCAECGYPQCLPAGDDGSVTQHTCERCGKLFEVEW